MHDIGSCYQQVQSFAQVCALFFGVLVDAATLKTKVSPVQKVIELLDDLKAKVLGPFLDL